MCLFSADCCMRFGHECAEVEVSILSFEQKLESAVRNSSVCLVDREHNLMRLGDRVNVELVAVKFQYSLDSITHQLRVGVVDHSNVVATVLGLVGERHPSAGSRR